MRPLRTAVLAGLVMLTGTLLLAGAPAVAEPAHRSSWTGAWATAPQRPMPGNDWLGPNWSMEGFAAQSVRQVVRVSTGGPLVRIRLSNVYGTRPLRLAGASIGRADEGAAIRPGTLRPLTFGHARSVTIPAGGQVASDATLLVTAPLDRLTVTLYFAEPTGPATFHEGGLTTTYRAAGDRVLDHRSTGFAGPTSHSWYYLTGVDVAGAPSRGAVVALGDSITDGYGSTRDADNRYPDELAERLAAAGRPMGVLNAGINSNMLLNTLSCTGDRAVDRFRRDVLDQPGVRAVVVLLGVNDILSSEADYGCGRPPRVTVEQLIEGHRTLIRAARARGVKIIGATLTPMKGEYWYTERSEGMRDALNHWIRTGGEFDAVADLDRALADPADPDALRAEYDSGDDLHPNDAGMRAMAAAVERACR